MNIEFPQLTAIDNAIARSQADAEKFRKLADEICKPCEDIGRIAKKLRVPDVKVPQGLAKAIASTGRIQEKFNAINQSTIESLPNDIERHSMLHKSWPITTRL